MSVKYKNTEKLFEALPRQSTVDQLKRIRDEINKSQIIKVGPDESSMSGDVGDRVTKDLLKHKGMNNLFWWDNPLDRHIDSYESFVKDDSRDSLGYTKNGDPKSHRGTDYVKENKSIEDPYGEEEWPDIILDDEITSSIRKNLLEKFNNKYGGRYDERIKNIKYIIGEESLYEIVSYSDEGRKNDSLGFAIARSKKEALSIFIINDKKHGNINDILFTGFYGAVITSQNIINERKLKYQRELNKLENICSYKKIKI